jgi:von Willebrand factor type D domain
MVCSFRIYLNCLHLILNFEPTPSTGIILFFSTCKGGTWYCDKNECNGKCKITGESHFATFDNRGYDFNGRCSYVLAQSQTNAANSFRVSFSNICGVEGVPCSRSVKIEIGRGNTKESITLSKNENLSNSIRFLF